MRFTAKKSRLRLKPRLLKMGYRALFIGCLLAFILLSFAKWPDFSRAEAQISVGAPRPRTRLERYFDFDRDGFLSQYEGACLLTHQTFGWPLAKGRKKKVFDQDANGLLDPLELQAYQETQSKKTPYYFKVPMKKQKE